jgi:hypothetical protein
MKVRKGATYVYRPCIMDACDPRTRAIPAGSLVRVCHPFGCPRPNTMNHAHVETLAGEFIGLVCCGSLHRRGQV